MKKTRISITVVCIMVLQLLLYPLCAYAADLYVASDIHKNTPVNTTLNFTIQDFMDAVTLPEGGDLVSIEITQLTNEAAGTLRLGTDAVELNATINKASLDQLNFVPAKDYEGEAIFTWSANYGEATSPYPGACVITVGESSEVPPDSSASPEATTSPAPTEVPTATPEPGPTLKPLQYEDMLDHWGAYSAGLLATKGYIVGEEIQDKFYFYPEKVLNRIEFIIMVNSIFGVQAKDSLADNPFSDTGVPGYMLRHAIAAKEAGIISGAAEGDALYLHPYDKVTRIEAAKILDNALKVETPNTNELDFADANTIPEWGIQALKNMEGYGIIRGFDDNTFRPYSSITKAQAAEMLWQTLKYVEETHGTGKRFNTVLYK